MYPSGGWSGLANPAAEPPAGYSSNMVAPGATCKAFFRPSVSKAGAANIRRLLLDVVPHYPLLLAAPVAVFFGIPLVVVFLALGEGDAGFHQVAFPVQLGADAGQALLGGGGQDPGQLLFMQQQFAGAGGVGDEMGGCGVQRYDLAAQQPGLATLDQHIGVPEVGLAHAQAFDFPARQHDAGLEGLQQLVIEAGALVAGDNIA